MLCAVADGLRRTGTHLGPDEPQRFRDRADAGRRLAARLERYRTEQPVVLALPRGGVPVAYEVARALHAPLDVFPVRKLGAPGYPEWGIGAIAPGGTLVIDMHAVRELGLSRARVQRIAAEEQVELERRLRRYRGDRPLPDLCGRTVILVDDGLATGSSATAAIAAIRRMAPQRIVLAVPVCARDSCDKLRTQVDDVVCVLQPDDFYAVGLWYYDFSQTSDDEVMELIERAREPEARPA